MGFMDQFKDAMSAGAPSQQDMEYMQRINRLATDFVEHPATITSLEATGKTDMGGGTGYQVTVEVQPEGAAPYGASFFQYMHEASMGSWASEGAAVKVHVDPADPSNMILWGGQT